MKKIFKLFAIALSVVFILLIIFSIFFVGYLFDNNFDDADFNSTQWKILSNNMDYNNSRGPMCDNLMSNYLKKGMKKQEIIYLLGEPDIKYEKNFFSYNLGMWSGLRMDYDTLDLQFNNEELIKFYIIQH